MKAKPMKWDWPSQALLSENGEIGDCWRCCIAAVLQLPADKVPHFKKIHKGACDVETQVWLNDRGFFIAWAPRIEFPRWAGNKLEMPVIAEGPSSRSSALGQHHAVVMIHDVVVYDPHPSKAGLTAVTGQSVIARLNHAL